MKIYKTAWNFDEKCIRKYCKNVWYCFIAYSDSYTTMSLIICLLEKTDGACAASSQCGCQLHICIGTRISIRFKTNWIGTCVQMYAIIVLVFYSIKASLDKTTQTIIVRICRAIYEAFHANSIRGWPSPSQICFAIFYNILLTDSDWFKLSLGNVGICCTWDKRYG